MSANYKIMVSVENLTVNRKMIMKITPEFPGIEAKPIFKFKDRMFILEHLTDIQDKFKTLLKFVKSGRNYNSILQAEDSDTGMFVDISFSVTIDNTVIMEIPDYGKFEIQEAIIKKTVKNINDAVVDWEKAFDNDFIGFDDFDGYDNY